MILYQVTGKEYKGNLHLHTTRSDGRLSPLKALTAYEAAGYDFLAITDHRLVTRVPEYQGRMLLLPGIELDFEPHPNEAIHLLGIGVGEGLMQAPLRLSTAQEGIDLIARFGGLCYLAHPHWSMNRLATIRELRGLNGAEIFNAVSRPPYNPLRAEAIQFLDLLAAEGMPLPTLANDDAHFYGGDLFGGYILLQADNLSHEGVMGALRAGRYYATQGPRFHSVTLSGDEVQVTCDPVRHVIFHSNLTWSDGRCASGQGVTQASYRVSRRRGESFVRVVLEDAQGRRAWMNPYPV